MLELAVKRAKLDIVTTIVSFRSKKGPAFDENELFKACNAMFPINDYNFNARIEIIKVLFTAVFQAKVNEFVAPKSYSSQSKTTFLMWLIDYIKDGFSPNRPNTDSQTTTGLLDLVLADQDRSYRNYLF